MIGHADHAGGQVYIGPPKGHEFAAAQARVERESPEAAVAWLERSQESGRRLRRDDSVTLASHCRKAQVVTRVHCHIAIFDRAPVDDAERHQHVTKRRGVLAVREESR